MQSASEEHANSLERDGVVVIEDYLDADVCDTLYSEISEAIDGDGIDVVRGGGYSYEELVNWGGPVAEERTGRDEGMIDVFNADELFPEVASFKTDRTVNEIVERAASSSYAPENVNVYWNRSVTDTRDFHADTYTGKFKSFLYLTDVPDRSYGPFGYVKGSHRASSLKVGVSKLLNSIRNRPPTDGVFYDEDAVVYYTAGKGTLIIANQAGYHRGHPQEAGKERMLMTTSYTPEA